MVKHTKRTRRFYKAQNKMIDVFLGHYHKVSVEEYEITPPIDPKKEEEERSQPAPVRMAINVSFGLNVALLGLKVTAAAMSGSMTMIAASADSLLDLISGLVFFIMQRVMEKK
jgi:Co/Zn/Cd efflux system component